jgi:hypothetical protein
VTTPDIRPLAKAVFTMVESAITFPLGDHEAPTLLPKKPWGIMYLITGGELSGPPLWSPDADADVIFQFDVTGLRPDHALFGGDQVRRTMLSRSGGVFQVPSPDLTEFAMKINGRLPAGPVSGIIPGGDPGHRVYSWSERYAVQVTPS